MQVTAHASLELAASPSPLSAAPARTLEFGVQPQYLGFYVRCFEIG